MSGECEICGDHTLDCRCREIQREIIVKEHPLLFFSCKHFECLDGWLGIIERLADKLEPLIEKWVKENPNEDGFYPCAAQVKEKYGTLSFYMSSYTDEMFDLTQEAWEESRRTCEVCGKPGKLSEGPWYSTYCPDHMEK